MDLHIECRGLKFTDHCRTAPPAAAAALKRGTLDAYFIIKTDAESSLQPEIAIMESCGMAVMREEEMDMGDDAKLKTTTLELSATERIFVMWDVRCSGNLPLSPAQLYSIYIKQCSALYR